MLTITKHGAEAHFVRPDGVMRTSVLQAIPGYHPAQNAQGVALRFTQPHYFSTTLSGALGAGIPLLQRIALKVRSAVARRRALAVMRRAGAVSGLGGLFGNTDIPYEAVIALPTVHGPGKYGHINANEQMAHVAMRITAGLPPQATMPDVAEAKMAAAARIAPNYAAMPSELAARVAAYAPPQVAMAAYKRGIGWFNRVRMWWYG